MTTADAIFQGIIQGLTEFLPVSSSGHLSLTHYFTGQSSETSAMYIVLLHIGSLGAVFIAFRKLIGALIIEAFRMLGDIFGGRFSLKDMPPQRRMIVMLIVSLLPMGFSFLMRDMFTAAINANSILVEGLAFLLTSFLLFWACRCKKGRKDASNMRYKDALAVGFMQAVAPIPGLSRSGSTISVGLIMGLDRKHAVAFSFLMGVPVILAACVLEFFEAGGVSGIAIPMDIIVIGIAFALISSLLAIKILSWIVVSDKFK